MLLVTAAAAAAAAALCRVLRVVLEAGVLVFLVFGLVDLLDPELAFLGISVSIKTALVFYQGYNEKKKKKIRTSIFYF